VHAFAWLLTYLLHSSVLLVAAALLRLVLRERQLVLQEAVLRVALVGGFLTTALQMSLPLKPWGGALALPPPEHLPVSKAPTDEEALWREPPPPSRQPSMLPSWEVWLGTLWGASAALALLRLTVSALRLRALLRHGRPIAEGGLRTEAQVLSARLGLSRVRLSASSELTIPLATGLVRLEVCLPNRVIDRLSPDEQAALCAHELAHLARRDPLWILLGRLVEAVAPLQPLNLWARRRLQDVSECLSDDLAVGMLGRPMALVRSLVDVAGWALSQPTFLPAAAGAFSSRSRLGYRVERIMDPLRVLETPRRFLLPVAAALVLGSTLITPVVSGRARAQEPSPPPEVEAPNPPSSPEAVAAPKAPRARMAEPGEPAAPEPPLPPRRPRLEVRVGTFPQEGEMERLEVDMERLEHDQVAQAEMADELTREIEELAHKMTEGMGKDESRLAEIKRRVGEITRKVREALKSRSEVQERRLEVQERRLKEQIRALAEGSASREARRGAEEIKRAAAEARRAAEEAQRAAREAVRAAEEALRSLAPKSP